MITRAVQEALRRPRLVGGRANGAFLWYFDRLRVILPSEVRRPERRPPSPSEATSPSFVHNAGRRFANAPENRCDVVLVMLSFTEMPGNFEPDIWRRLISAPQIAGVPLRENSCENRTVVMSLTPFAILLALTLSAQTRAETGVIKGRVVDKDGTPVKAALVNAELLGSPMAKAIRYVTADETGTFLIDRLAFGTYHVFGKKEEEGFADTHWFSSTEAPRITISAQQPSGNVLLMFGPKAGVLAGMVRDARTGKPVLAGFTLRRLSDSWFLSSSQPSNFRIFVPASTDVSIEVESPSYRTWAYMNPTSNSRQLRLDPGGQIHLDITLLPQPDESRVARLLVPEGYRGG